MADEGFFRPLTLFDTPDIVQSNPSYRQAVGEGISHALRQLLPAAYFDSKWQEERSPESIRKKLLTLLPLVKFTRSGNIVCFYSLYRYRVNSFKFFFDLVSQWLIPGKRLDVNLVYAVDLQFPAIGQDVFTVCEIVIKADVEDVEAIERNFPLIETEARLGIDSEYYSRKILEIKGVAPDQKTSMIQHRIATAMKRLPEIFSSDAFTEMQHILVLCDEDFKNQRSISHLSRLIAVHHLFRRRLLDWIENFSHKRKVLVKLFRANVKFPQGEKNILSILVGLNFLRSKEVFEQRHLLQAIKRYIPNAEAIDQTYFSNRRGSEKIMTIYLEIEKTDNKKFSSEEITKLKNHLPQDLQNHIRQLLPPVFMPRNEEEIMRNILSLSQQLKYLRDIPQVFISFDEQTDRNIFFTVIVVRILYEKSESIGDMIRAANTFLRYIHDRSRIVGVLRQKYPKEATVFRIKFAKESFLRGDHSVDLYKARQALVNELTGVIGEFRDFNGGMISKQNELLNEVKLVLNKEGVKFDDVFLENFFYSLSPVIMRTVLESHAFISLFSLLLSQIENGMRQDQKLAVLYQNKDGFTYVTTAAAHWTTLDEISRMFHKVSHSGTDLVQGYIKTPDYVCTGYIYRNIDIKKQEQFRDLVASIQ